MNTLESFKELGISEFIIKALEKKGFEEPTPIQKLTIPKLMEGKIDLIGQAQTGTGKTAAFGIPLIEKIEGGDRVVKALILTPTRELAIQVSEELNSLKGKKKLSIFPVYGGASMENQFSKLRHGVDIVVGTPGRVIDHLNRGTLDLSEIDFFVLDEADEMLDMGFIEDVEEILKKTSPEKQMLFFSATMPTRILSLAKKYMRKYEVLKVKEQQLTTDLTEQIYFEVEESDKFEALCRIIDIEKDFYGLIFCRTKVDVDNVSTHLSERGYSSEALHGDISQYQRERILKKFKNKNINILVATDVAARGIDITELTHVINYALPQNPESYVHRIGRTGRAGKEGTAITFVTPSEYRKLIFIKKYAKTEIRKEKIPEIEEVINTKKERIKDDITSIIENKDFKEYLKISEELLELGSPEDIIASLIKYTLKDELDEKSYSQIKPVSVVNKSGKTRLFVALGRSADMTPKKIVNYIKDESGVSDRLIKDVKVFENFSFLTVPFEEAEIILEVFRKKKRGRKPIVEVAKEKKQ